MQRINLFAEQKKVEWLIFNNLEKIECKEFIEEGSSLRLNDGKNRKVKAISDVQPDSLESFIKPIITRDERLIFNEWKPLWGKVTKKILDSKVDAWNYFINQLAHLYPEVVSTKTYWKSVQQHVWFYSVSTGMREDFRSCFMVDFYVTVRKGSQTKQSNVTKSWASPEDVTIEDLRELINYVTYAAIEQLDARSLPSGCYTLILGPLAAPGVLHEAIGHGLESDIASIPHSAFNNSIGEIIGSKKLNIIDDPTRKGLPGSYSIDDEGIIAKPTFLVEEGKVIDYMRHAHTDRESNGHGRVLNYGYPPLVRMSNTFLLPGEDEPEEMIQDTKSGLYIKKAVNGDVNMITGEFAIHVTEGYFIDNGKITFPITPILLRGDGRKLLRSIDRVGHDFGVHSEVRGGCGKFGQSPLPVSAGTPTVRVLDWQVKGSET